MSDEPEPQACKICGIEWDDCTCAICPVCWEHNDPACLSRCLPTWLEVVIGELGEVAVQPGHRRAMENCRGRLRDIIEFIGDLEQ